MSLRLSHGGVGQKVDPDSVGPLAVLGDGFLLVADPVQVPPVDGRRVVNSKDVDGPDFKVGVFKLRAGSEMSATAHGRHAENTQQCAYSSENPVESAGGISTGEDVLVHAVRDQEQQVSFSDSLILIARPARTRDPSSSPRTAKRS